MHKMQYNASQTMQGNAKQCKTLMSKQKNTRRKRKTPNWGRTGLILIRVKII